MQAIAWTKDDLKVSNQFTDTSSPQLPVWSGDVAVIW